jgi:hypothetical protein
LKYSLWIDSKGIESDEVECLVPGIVHDTANNFRAYETFFFEDTVKKERSTSASFHKLISEETRGGGERGTNC